MAAIALGDAQGFRGDMEAALPARLEAAEASAAAGDTIFSLLAYVKVAITLREQGRLGRTIEICRQQFEFAQHAELSRNSVAGGLLAIEGEVLAEQGHLARAVDLATRGVELVQRDTGKALLGWSYLCFTRVLFSQGDLAGAQKTIGALQEMAQGASVPPWIMTGSAIWQARLWLAEGNLKDASRWAREHEVDACGELRPSDQTDFISLNVQVAVARVLMAQRRLDDATELLTALQDAAEAGGRISSLIEILVLQALAYQNAGQTVRAMNSLERALTLAEPEGFRQIFVDEGPAMARLLRAGATRGLSPTYAAMLLGALGETPADEEPIAKPPHAAGTLPVLVEPLSDRELEVLTLVAEGATNGEIASRLFLSLNTVKAHTRNIYGKLDVHNRTQAVARAKALGILPHAGSPDVGRYR
jgi:LuxR family maltose regulon positive regulatory protein